MNFNLGELENLFLEIKEKIDYVEQIELDSRKSILFLSNGDKLALKVFKENIAHLLGINIEYLKSTRLYSNTNSYELLKELIDEPYKLHKNVKDGYITYDNIFSAQIHEKIKIFEFNIKTNIFETELVCKYDSEKTFTYTDKNQKYDYIIVKKDNNTGAYGALCIVKNGEQYVPMSSLYFENYESLKEQLGDVLKNQEITLLSGHKPYSIYGEISKTFILQEASKATKLSTLQNYKKDFKCIIDTSADFIYLLNSSLQHKNQRYSNTNLISVMMEAIEQGNLLDLEMFLNTGLIDLAKTINDYLVNNSVSFDREVEENYSQIYEDRRQLSEKLKVLQEKYDSLELKHEETIKNNEELMIENDEYKKSIDIAIKALKPSQK